MINDGQLQLRIFTGDGLLPALFTTLTQPEESPNIIDGTSAWFEVIAPHGMTFNLDGEPLSGERFRIEVLPGALQCRLPPDCQLCADVLPGGGPLPVCTEQSPLPVGERVRVREKT